MFCPCRVKEGVAVFSRQHAKHPHAPGMEAPLRCTFNSQEMLTDGREKRRKPDMWSPQERNEFIDVFLAQGRDFKAVLERVKSKNKEQVRQFYYRSLGASFFLFLRVCALCVCACVRVYVHVLTPSSRKGQQAPPALPIRHSG